MFILTLAAFTAPENIGIDMKSFLWLLPLVAAIAIVYKALKVKEITPADFIKQALILSGTILVFMIIVAMGLYVITWLITE